MTEQDIALVQSSWAQVLPKADMAMDQFYERLFHVTLAYLVSVTASS